MLSDVLGKVPCILEKKIRGMKDIYDAYKRQEKQHTKEHWQLQLRFDIQLFIKRSSYHMSETNNRGKGEEHH